MALIYCKLGARRMQYRNLMLFLLNRAPATHAYYGHYAFGDLAAFTVLYLLQLNRSRPLAD